jgi:hypothetical protein
MLQDLAGFCETMPGFAPSRSARRPYLASKHPKHYIQECIGRARTSRGGAHDIAVRFVAALDIPDKTFEAEGLCAHKQFGIEQSGAGYGRFEAA